VITRIEALNYRCLRYVAQDLGPFQVLVGPNASGKSTFLDVIALLGDILQYGLEDALLMRAPNYADLFWGGKGHRFELVIEAKLPEHELCDPPASHCTACRYEVAIGQPDDGEGMAILAERLWLRPPRGAERSARGRFPDSRTSPSSILAEQATVDWLPLLSEAPRGSHTFRSELDPKAHLSVKIGRRDGAGLAASRSALDYLPRDDDAFHVAAWFRSLLTELVFPISLDCGAMRLPSPPPISERTFRADGSNLPWLVQKLETAEDSGLLAKWLGHVQTALPELQSLRSVVREEDKHCYLKLLYDSGVEVPSWLVSDGTLRMLALTLIPYLPGWLSRRGVYLIEEPENGIHPADLETVYQSLMSVYEGQVLLATHSPALLTMADLDQVLCFGKAPDGGVDICSGREHPRLRHWHHEVSLGTYLAGGVLG